MKNKKSNFMLFTIAVLSLMIVIFNNTIDLIDKIFHPEFRIVTFFSFGLLIVPCVWYVVYNWSDK